MTHCRYHCRSCGSHFASLESFDRHRPRFASEGGCAWPELPPGYEFVEKVGVCRISDGLARPGAIIHSLVRPGKYAAESRESAEGQARGAVPA
jgi:hypothetical protein